MRWSGCGTGLQHPSNRSFVPFVDARQHRDRAWYTEPSLRRSPAPMAGFNLFDTPCLRVNSKERWPKRKRIPRIGPHRRARRSPIDSSEPHSPRHRGGGSSGASTDQIRAGVTCVVRARPPARCVRRQRDAMIAAFAPVVFARGHPRGSRVRVGRARLHRGGVRLQKGGPSSNRRLFHGIVSQRIATSPKNSVCARRGRRAKIFNWLKWKASES
jgi:hypothetical protein